MKSTLTHVSDISARLDPRAREAASKLAHGATVSFRYVVDGPIRLEAVLPPLPDGLGLEGAQLLAVDPIQAVGFSHRITYDAPALGCRQEELHHQLLDAETGDPLLLARQVAEPGRLHLDDFWGLPTLPCTPPERIPDVSVLHGLALHELDARSLARGEELEAELGARLAAAEARIASYFDQQAAEAAAPEREAIAREIAWIEGRMAQTALPGARAKLAARLEEARALMERIEADLACSTPAERERSLARERERHELSVTTALVAVCHLTYDRVVYRVAIARGELVGRRRVEVVPVTGEVRWAPCPRCKGSLPPGGVTADGEVLCTACAEDPPARVSGAELPSFAIATTATCRQCGLSLPPGHPAPWCVACTHRCGLCGKDAASCKLVGGLCPEHLVPCARCAVPLIESEAFRCPCCGAPHCEDDRENCPACGLPACPRCARILAGHCLACAQLRPASCEDPDVRQVLAVFPDLRRGVSWRTVRAGGYLLAAWEGQLRAGMIVLDPAGSVLSAFWRWKLNVRRAGRGRRDRRARAASRGRTPAPPG